ncbi:DUF5317 family protein [Phytoactinopolyspora halotolerans]|uniref:DUF5317 domain-containing protein n=1 Tax=Phytoactinopolyspora halotolerans TaxID=1981512 RepID=A0A6L9SC19_9ACTN|nr:DUF5317 family protein [Phytoactinopolyspora halotolerans]NEE02559.1 hypothetical protein [Phytoactinopolyspora halotolerans]
MNNVVLIVLALAAGLTVGYVKGGRLRRLAEPPPARNRLLLTALGLYVIAVFASWAWETALALLSGLAWLVVAFYAWVNRWAPGARLIALGICANALVLIVNGAVPVAETAAARAGAETATADTENAEPADDSTRLSWLGKNIPIAFPPRPEVASPGDLAIAAGLATFLATGMLGHRPLSNALPDRRRARYPEDQADEPEPIDDQPADTTDTDGPVHTTAHDAATGQATRASSTHGRVQHIHATMRRREKGDIAPTQHSERSGNDLRSGHG